MRSPILGAPRSSPWHIDQHDIGVLLHSFQHDFTAVWRDIKVSHVEAAAQAGQLTFASILEIDEPEVLVFDLRLASPQAPGFPAGTACVGLHASA